MKFNKELAKRFVSDYKLPISITFEEDIFYYQLWLTEDEFKSETKYKELREFIDDNYDGNPDLFLQKYYDVRETIIQSILNNESFINFNSKLDMKQFEIKDKPNVSANNVYNCENKGKTYLSIDLKKANFQALRWVDPNIVFNTNTYEEFIGKFTSSDYVKESKYTRQVIWGKCNPKRHITVEKYIINEVRKLVEKIFETKDCANNYKLVSMTNDEIVYETNIWSLIDFETIDKQVKEILGIDIHVALFKLDAYQLRHSGNEHSCKTFFAKEMIWDEEVKTYTIDKHHTKLISVPLPFFNIVYKLFNKSEIGVMDRYFPYEGMCALLIGDFTIEKL